MSNQGVGSEVPANTVLLKKKRSFKFSPCIFLERDLCLWRATKIAATRVRQV